MLMLMLSMIMLIVMAMMNGLILKMDSHANVHVDVGDFFLIDGHVNGHVDQGDAHNDAFDG